MSESEVGLRTNRKETNGNQGNIITNKKEKPKLEKKNKTQKEKTTNQKEEEPQESLVSCITNAFRKYNALVPRIHQLRTVGRMMLDIASHEHGEKIRNYLIQHPAGSGKSLTIACLALCLYHFKNNAGRRGFDTVLVLNDRKELDTQLSDALIGFLRANGVNNVQHSQTSQHLESLLQNNCRIIITTVQKFVQLAPTNFMVKRRIAIIADEAHRTHGSASTAKLHEFLIGSSDQSNLITYFSFTCTPTKKTLEMFGIKEKNNYIPFYSYSVKQAIQDKIILDVLNDYTTVLEPMLPMVEEQGEDAFIKRKSMFILDHFLHKSVSLSNKDFTPKGMLVVNGRQNILSFKRQLEQLISTTVPSDKQFDIVCMFAPLQTTEGLLSETDSKVNGQYASKNLVEVFKDSTSKVKLIIVAEKLQTGFDAPILSIMYIDKPLKGPTAVQTLGRLSRVASGKKSVCIVDFHNTCDEMKLAFDEFIYSLKEDKDEDQRLAQAHENNDIIKNLINGLTDTKLSKETLNFKLSILKPETATNSKPKLNHVAVEQFNNKKKEKKILKKLDDDDEKWNFNFLTNPRTPSGTMTSPPTPPATISTTAATTPTEAPSLKPPMFSSETTMFKPTVGTRKRPSISNGGFDFKPIIKKKQTQDTPEGTLQTTNATTDTATSVNATTTSTTAANATAINTTATNTAANTKTTTTAKTTTTNTTTTATTTAATDTTDTVMSPISNDPIITNPATSPPATPTSPPQSIPTTPESINSQMTPPSATCPVIATTEIFHTIVERKRPFISNNGFNFKPLPRKRQKN